VIAKKSNRSDGSGTILIQAITAQDRRSRTDGMIGIRENKSECDETSGVATHGAAGPQENQFALEQSARRDHSTAVAELSPNDSNSGHGLYGLRKKGWV
jgi:hypothetical protein